MSSNIIPQEIRGLFINDKTDKFKGVGFQWKVDLTYIMPNLWGELQVLSNLNQEGCN